MNESPPLLPDADESSRYDVPRLLVTFAFLGLVAVFICFHGKDLIYAVDNLIPFQANFYYYTFVHFEPPILIGLILFFLGTAFFLPILGKKADRLAGLLQDRRTLWLGALLVLILASLGRFYLHQNFDLCIDECLNDFQAKILARGELRAEVPPEWRSSILSLNVGYVRYNPVDHRWASQFLPGFAFLDFLARSVALDWALSPALAALAVLLVGALAARAAPDYPALARGLAGLILAFSPQFLAMAMTKFSWTAHLTGSLVWVWLITHPQRRIVLFAPLFGLLLIGLHQPQVHLLIALPFLLRLVARRDWLLTAWFVGVYALGSIAWYQILLLLRTSPQPGASGGGGLAELHGLTFPWVASIANNLFHSVTVLAWSTPCFLPFLLVLLATWHRQPPLVRDSFWAGLLTFAFYLTFPNAQGHGWGYRYLHSAYGLLVLAATGGALVLVRDGLRPAVLGTLAASVAFSIVIQFPYRAWEMRQMVKPLADTSRYLASLPCDFIVLKTNEFWYAWDLMRNDPDLKNRPLIFARSLLTSEQRRELDQRGSVREIGAAEVRRFGVVLSDPTHTIPQPAITKATSK